MLFEVIGRIFAYAASVGILAGLVLAAVAAGARAKARQAADWPRRAGRIIQAPAPPRRLFGGLASGLRYRYEADGRLHEGGRLTLLDWPAFAWGRRAPRAPAGGQVCDVLVNPALPEDALLDASAPPVRAVWSGLAFALACLAFLILRRLM